MFVFFFSGHSRSVFYVLDATLSLSGVAFLQPVQADHRSYENRYDIFRSRELPTVLFVFADKPDHLQHDVDQVSGGL